MVVFVDLDSEDDDPSSHVLPKHHTGLSNVHRLSQSHSLDRSHKQDTGVNGKEDSDLNGVLFASALACYPVSLSIAAQLDLNDLYSLTFTCRTIHRSLSQFAHQLRTQSLRCINEVTHTMVREGADGIIFHDDVSDILGLGMPSTNNPAFPLPFSMDVGRLHIHQGSSLGLSGKTSKCARDLVGPCRKCGVTVCRNCAAKPPSDRCLPNRHRRLCRTCLDAPLTEHLRELGNDRDLQDSPPVSSASSARSVRSESSSCTLSDRGNGETPQQRQAFTSPSFLRHPCNCASRGVFLCQPCGQSLNAADTTYKRVWTWRSRYSTHIGGGLGTGLGLGNQGQKCGRGEHCLERGVAGVCWVEIECSEVTGQGRGRDDSTGISRSSTPLAHDYETDGFIVNRPGYFSQELEGIGGVLKKKVKKRVKVGATVYEYDDERETSKYLLREASGRERSWCGWCSRVCPGEKDEREVNHFIHQHR